MTPPVHAASGRRRALGALLGGVCAVVGAPTGLIRAAFAGAPRFALGVASGYPRPDGVVLWTRLTGSDLPAQVPVQWEVSEDEQGRHVVARGVELAQADGAHSVHAEPAGLVAGRPYWYRFTALGDRSAMGRTRTAPAPDALAPLRFAIASCQRFEHGAWAAWADVAAFAPDLVLFLGDYIYEYPSMPGAVRQVSGGLIHTLDGYRERYAQYKADPLLQAAHAAAPWVLVWDDHEVENDYAGLQGGLPFVDFEAQRAAAYQAYWEHQPFPKSMRPAGASMGLYARLDWGRLARIHLLDNRQHRDPQACPRPGRLFGSGTVAVRACPELDDPRRSLLGLAQERWLAEGWSLERRWNLLAQQTLIAPRMDVDRQGHATVWSDGWDGYGPARQRLLSAAVQRAVPGLVALGGDVHAHYAAHLHADPLDPRTPLVGTEFCGTSISSRGPPASRMQRTLALNPHIVHGDGRERGSVHFQLDADRLQADLRAVERVDDPGSAVRSQARFIVEQGRGRIEKA
ncbi:MAG: alkaline phosphatase D family protein [Rubrivivax sp.]